MYWHKTILKTAAFCLLALWVMSTASLAAGYSGEGPVKQMQAQANTMKERVAQQRDEEIDAHTKATQDKIQEVNESAEIDIANVPAYFVNGWGYRVPNPDYERSVAYIRIDAQKKIYAINNDLANETKKINAVYQEKLNAIDSSADNTASQIRPGKSEIQMSPVGANLYVKNYVNYVSDQPKPTGLKAKQNKLAGKTSKQTGEKDIKP